MKEGSFIKGANMTADTIILLLSVSAVLFFSIGIFIFRHNKEFHHKILAGIIGFVLAGGYPAAVVGMIYKGII